MKELTSVTVYSMTLSSLITHSDMFWCLQLQGVPGHNSWNSSDWETVRMFCFIVVCWNKLLLNNLEDRKTFSPTSIQPLQPQIMKRDNVSSSIAAPVWRTCQTLNTYCARLTCLCFARDIIGGLFCPEGKKHTSHPTVHVSSVYCKKY